MLRNTGDKQGAWRARQRMVERQVIERGIRDERVIAALRRVPREVFVPEALRDRAYDDTPLPIGDRQTISQPFIVACMTETLRLQGGEKILEIGTGSGYQTAILAEIGGKVFSIERSFTLSATARKALEGLGYSNILLRVGDGTVGWAEFAPYDRIIVTAAAPALPRTLTGQLKEGGILVAPVGERNCQVLNIVRRTGEGLEITEGESCIFVPLIGKEGWPGS